MNPLFTFESVQYSDSTQLPADTLSRIDHCLALHEHELSTNNSVIAAPLGVRNHANGLICDIVIMSRDRTNARNAENVVSNRLSRAGSVEHLIQITQLSGQSLSLRSAGPLAEKNERDDRFVTLADWPVHTYERNGRIISIKSVPVIIDKPKGRIEDNSLKLTLLDSLFRDLHEITIRNECLSDE